ncbi:hypothetical protein FRB95_003801 [Tulasnella sp. JGI-2019a]|nr:hypothetical protein FRB95_003801 [Tulasnella sp. JGI-2019a]
MTFWSFDIWVSGHLYGLALRQNKFPRKLWGIKMRCQHLHIQITFCLFVSFSFICFFGSSHALTHYQCCLVPPLVLPVARAQLTARTVTFINQCSSDVWIKPTTGASGKCADGCPVGSTCDTTNGNCYYNNPTPSTGNYRVKKGGSNQIVYPAAQPGVGIVWNGNYAFCQSGTTCSETTDVCDASGCRATGPFPLTEFNLATNSSDFYDVSIIAGVAVPISITPTLVDSGNTKLENPYACGNPGSKTPGTATLGPSSWNFSPPSNSYQWVTPAGMNHLTVSFAILLSHATMIFADWQNDSHSDMLRSCTKNTGSSTGHCGVIFQAGSFKQVCGYLSGYWSENSVCGYNTATSLFNCDQNVPNGQLTTTINKFQGCADSSSSDSCYSDNADAQCCGCANWNTILRNASVPYTTELCKKTNPIWASTILPTLKFLKTGCPNCCTYPYDNFSSTFTCEKTVGGYNTQNYTVTLCPSGVSFAGNPNPSAPTPTGGATTPTTTPGTAKCSGVSYNTSTS